MEIHGGRDGMVPKRAGVSSISREDIERVSVLLELLNRQLMPKDTPSEPSQGGNPSVACLHFEAPQGISIVIPLWRDWSVLAHWLESFGPLPPDVEVIVAAVGKNPAPDAVLARSEIRVVECSDPNRGAQLNAGAAVAAAPVLLFHHADSHLIAAHLAALRACAAKPGFVGGAFHRKFDDRHPLLRWIEPLERWRCVHGRALFGDQSIFVRRDVFVELGGYAGIPLMEDFEFSRRLRRVGRLDLLDPPMLTSARHHRSRGAWRTSLRNLLFLLLFQCGVSPWRLHRWYYGGRTAPVGGEARVTSPSARA